MESALIGVSTVLDEQTCRDALTAGAEFVVTPICRPEFVAIVHAAQRPVMLGAYTPTEAQRAHEAGADLRPRRAPIPLSVLSYTS